MRLRLLCWLIGSVTLVAMAACWGVYQAVLIDTDALFDYQLRQTALSLRDQGAAPSLKGTEDTFDTVVQIWDEGGRRIYVSHPTSDLPQSAALGFADVHTRNGEWRAFGVRMRGRVIQVAQPVSVRRSLARAHAYRTLLPMLVLLPLLAAAVWLGVARALLPIASVERQVRARDPASLQPLADEGLPREIQPLVRSLNHLLERLSGALAMQRSFVADAAHELRSPLTALRLQLQLLERAPDRRSRRQAQERLAAGIERASHLVNQLLTLARSEPDAGDHPAAPVRLDETARLAIADVAPLADARRVDLGLAGAVEVTVQGESDALRVLARNLADNAVRHTPEGGRVDVTVRRARSEAVLEIADTGPGIPVAERARVLTRFYRRAGEQEGGSG
ncbi:MAG TPA: histidine kinase dimerization/phospho-acceptor domain-containing protein, partial [Burkholderiales bacterium]|nr:histidine kinase dimerization/phospho-acceptor domain-containing protein [Burkholderiales bacterium]